MKACRRCLGTWIVVLISIVLCGFGIAEEAAWKSGILAITVDGLEREFELDVPKGLEPGATLILVFHGYGGSSHIATTSPTRSSTRK